MTEDKTKQAKKEVREAKKAAKKAKKEAVQTNCLECNKPLMKKSKYYRNGKYYCAKKCFKALIAKQEKEKAASRTSQEKEAEEKEAKK